MQMRLSRLWHAINLPVQINLPWRVETEGKRRISYRWERG